MNKTALKIYNTSEKEYLNWCRKNHKASYKKESKQEYFESLKNKMTPDDKKTTPEAR